MMRKPFAVLAVELSAALVPLAPVLVSDAFAASNAMQICEARWDAHVKTLPAPPQPSVKSAFIKDCMKHPPTIPSTTGTHDAAAPLIVSPHEAEKPVTINPPEPEKLPAAGH